MIKCYRSEEKWLMSGTEKGDSQRKQPLAKQISSSSNEYLVGYLLVKFGFALTKDMFGTQVSFYERMRKHAFVVGVIESKA